MTEQTPPVHRRLAAIGLQVGGPFGFALAGGHAVAAHGILQRRSEDVDLFADWDRRADFPAAVDAVIAAYRADGLEVQVEMQTDLMARLHVTDPNRPDELHRVELVANWRFRPPVQMDIGPVLHPDDVMAGKIDALCNRAAARDFLDIDAAITSGRYTLDGSSPGDQSGRTGRHAAPPSWHAATQPGQNCIRAATARHTEPVEERVSAVATTCPP